jgi:hypothetical protein
MNETEFPEGVYELAGGQWPGESALRLVNEIAAHNRSELAQPLH